MGADAGLEKKLLVLMGARLALSVVSLGIAVGLEAAGWSYSPAEWRGFYGTIVFAFVATIGYGLIFQRIRNVARFSALNIATDVAIVSALVHLSGGADSPFAFLYVLVAAYGAVLLERRGALITATVAALVYGFVIFADRLGWLTVRTIGPPEPAPVLLSMWLVNAGAFVLVAWLASLLVGELRRTGEALEQRTTDLSRLRTLHERTVESLKSGLLTTDLDGRITSFNSEAERITRMGREHVIGRDVEEVLPGIRERLAHDIRADGSEGVGTRGRMAYRAAGDSQRHLGTGTYVLRDRDAAPEGHVVIFQDVTDVVEMEASLRKSERLAAIGELSASIAHEIRNPLAAISGSIEMLKGGGRGRSESADSEQLMKIVLREVERLDHLISDFLSYARPAPLKLQTVEIREVVEDVLKMFEVTRSESVRMVADLRPNLFASADSDQLRQVLWNLVLNAAQAMPDGGRLTVSAGVARGDVAQEAFSGGRKAAREEEGLGDSIEITVADEGQGIGEDQLERIFDPFFTTKRNGSGLGLATVHRIVESHGGSIHLESELGIGTTVRVTLPRAEVSG